MPDISPILKRLSNESGFALSDLRHNAISSGIIGYTSAIEYYLQDVIELCLRRNVGLRKKGFSGISISALELEKHTETKKIKRFLIKTLSSENSKGALFSDKLKKASSFLSIEPTIVPAAVVKSLDSIWRLRNRFAHENQISIDQYEILVKGNGSVLSRDAAKNEYFKFIVDLVKVIEEANDYLYIFDQKVLTKWSADAFDQ